MLCTTHADCQLSDVRVHCALYSDLSGLSNSVTKCWVTSSMAGSCRKAIVNFEDAFNSAPITVQSPPPSDRAAASESDGTPGRGHSESQKQIDLSMTVTSSLSVGSASESDIATGASRQAGELLPPEEFLLCISPIACQPYQHSAQV